MRVALLFSGGYDSSLAAIYIGKKEEALLFYFDLLGSISPLPYRISREISKILRKELPLYLVDFRKVVEEISSKVERKYRQVVLKRAMVKVANALAREVDADVLGTGEVIGQVSTQTLRSLRVIEEASGMPILRPIAGLDKEEIVNEIRRYGLFDLCSKVKEYCNIAGRKVVTWPDFKKVKREEAKIGDLLSKISWREYPEVKEEEIEFLDEIPEGAIIIDLSRGAIPGAISIEEFSPEDAKGRTVLIYCKSGGLSKEYARELRKLGIKAYPLNPKAIKKLRDRKR